MPLPTPGDVHVNRPLTNFSVAYIQDQKNFIAADVFPNIPVQKQSDSYYTYDHAYWNRDEMEVRAVSTESVGSGYKPGTDTYFAHLYAFHQDIPDQVRSNADVPINLDQEATAFVTLKALIKREKLFVSKFFGTGIWTTDITGVASAPGSGQVLQWNNANATPIENIWAGKEVVLQSTGFEPNTLVMGYSVLKYLVNHPQFVDRVKYGQTPNGPAMVDLTEIAALFKVDRVFIMKSIENTAKEGAATATHSFIGGKKVGLFYSPPSPGLMTPASGYTFSWTGHLGAGAQGNRIKRFRMEALASDRVEIEMAFDQKKISADLGYFFDSIVA